MANRIDWAERAAENIVVGIVVIISVPLIPFALPLWALGWVVRRYIGED